MALIDYKFWYIRRDDDGFITEAAIRFYTGDITTEIEFGQSVTRYRRTQRVGQTIMNTALNKYGVQIIFDGSGNTAVLLTPTQFGKIKTDAELVSYCNGVLLSFGITPIPQQIN